VSDLYERGIKNFVVSEYRDEFNILLKANFIVVEDTLKALQILGNHNRNQFTGNVTAIIGSNGKTIVKEWLYQLLHEDFKVVRSPKSYNSQLGVALSLNLLNDQQEMAFIEAGISQQGEMIKLQKIVTPKTVSFHISGCSTSGKLQRSRS
jgi:UDP-N-acetylmuramyl pentapeptide synthase